jgi:general secretion pathway protein B
MSYILEALKKSQKERELGQVPTLADAPYLADEKPGRGAYWGIVAVTLAVLATLIALYAAFGERLLSAGGPSPSMPETTREAAPKPGPTAPAPAPVAAAPEVAASANDVPRPEERPKAAQAPATPAAKAAASDSGRRPESSPKPSLAPEKTAKPETPPVPPVATEPAVVAPPTPALQLPPDIPNVPPELVREVRRFGEQLRQQELIAARQAKDPASAAAPPVQPPVQPPAPVAVEPEPTPAEEPARKVQAPPAPLPARKIPPSLSDLPAAQQQAIPEHRLTVHVYSATPEQRFAIINSRKMREGDRSREGLLLEEITPDGVTLEFRGQRFFHHR